jgi:peptidoglycan-associated lipoprotein
MYRLLPALLLFFLMAWMVGCTTMDSSDEAGPNDQTGRSGTVAGLEGARTSDLTDSALHPGSQTGRTGGYEPWNDPNNPLSNRTIYFEFDSIDVPPEYVPVIKTHAGFLATNPQIAVVLEGHADKRGTREYNIALGEQRARAVSKMMKLHGVRNTQIDFVSYGEEKPARLGHDEQSWRLNRRVEIVYPER